MIAKQKHIINKVFLEVNTNNKKVAYDLKDNLSVFLKQDIFPFINTYFEKIENSLPSEIVQIPKLNLDLTTSSKNNFEELKQIIKKQFVTEIQKTITASTNEQKTTIFISKNDNNLKSFLYFLEKGILPWNSLTTKKNRFDKKELQEIVKTKNFIPLFQQKIKNKTVQNRLINQFDTNEIKLILKQGFKDNTLEISIFTETLVTEILKLNNHNQKLIWRILISYLVDKNIPLLTDAIVKIISNVEKNKKFTKTEVTQVKKTINILFKNMQFNNENNLNLNISTLDKPKEHIQLDIDKIEIEYQEVKALKIKTENTVKALNHKKTKEPNNLTELLEENQRINNEKIFQDKTNYYVENAGLILLHPFLKQFFENCKLLTPDSKLKNEELAVHLLHYIATKKEKQLESNLIFEKFLCGVPIKQSINRNITISKKLKAQTKELLESVIQNWEILKNASTDLLRNEFLQRAGKLSFKGDNPKINIERKTQDILLDKLPWNISISKLPWLDKLIFTDW